jgi:hypothetical protein
VSHPLLRSPHWDYLFPRLSLNLGVSLERTSDIHCQLVKSFLNIVGVDLNMVSSSVPSFGLKLARDVEGRQVVSTGLLVRFEDSRLQAENDVASMWRILADMEEAGIRPDDRTYAYVA